jgi:DNA-binding NarL/FixJ family response regulator
VDDQALVRAGLRVLLEGEDDIEVVGEAEDGLDALALVRRTGPDVVLMDLSMPGMGGLEATREIVADHDERSAGTKILILTTFQSDDDLFNALRAGASAFLAKDAEPPELLRAIRVIAEGDALLSPSITRRLIAEFASRPEPRTPSAEQLRWLTAREQEVMALVAVGLNNDEIAQELVISRATAKTHVSRAMRKLGAHDRAQLVVFAYTSGLVNAARTAHAAGASR